MSSLDVNSWGAIFLRATGRTDLARAALDPTSLFASADPPVIGFSPRPPSASPLVWSEGTAGVALAQQRLGDRAAAAATLRGLAPAALPSGAWPGATRDDDSIGMTTAAAVGATAWVLLAGQALAGRPAIWDEGPNEGAPAHEL